MLPRDVKRPPRQLNREDSHELREELHIPRQYSRPELQAHVLGQVASPKVVAADTMKHWIANERHELNKLLPRLDILAANGEEARMLSGEHNEQSHEFAVAFLRKAFGSL
jgi:hypothetical protein